LAPGGLLAGLALGRVPRRRPRASARLASPRRWGSASCWGFGSTWPGTSGAVVWWRP